MQIRVETIAELKAIKFGRFDTIVCVETEKEYYLEPNGSGLTPDDDDYIQAAHGANYRYVAMEARGTGGGGGGAFASQAEAEAGTDTTKYMNPLRTAQAIAAQVGGGGGSGAVTEIIFDPDIATSTATNKKTFAEVQTAINAAPGMVRLIVKKVGVLQVAAAEAGSWNFSKVGEILGTPDSLGVILQFGEGSSIVPPAAMQLSAVTLRYVGTSAPLITVSSVMAVVLNYGAIATGSGAAAEAIRVANGAFLVLHAQGETPVLYRGDYEVVDCRGLTTIHLWDIAASSFFAANDIFRNDPGGLGMVQIRSRVLVEDGYAGSHANYTDGVDPIPVSVTQLSEQRVNQLVSAAVAPYQIFADVKNASASNFTFTGTTPPTLLNSQQYKWIRFAGGLNNFAGNLSWNTPGVGITKFTCEWATEGPANPIPGYSSGSVPKFFWGTVGDGVNYYPCRVKFLRENNAVPAQMEVTMDSPVNLSYFHCDFTYRFSP